VRPSRVLLSQVHILLPARCTRVTVSYSAASQTRSEGRVSQAAVRGSNPLWALRRHWNNRKYGASKLKLPCVKEFLRKLAAFSACTLKNFASPVIGRKNLKNVGFKGSQIISLPGVPTCVGPALPLAELSLVSSRQLDISLLSNSYRAPSQKASQAGIFFIIMFGAWRPKRVYLGFKFQKFRVSNRNSSCHKCTLVQLQCAWLFLVRLDFTALSVLRLTELENVRSHVSLQAFFTLSCELLCLSCIVPSILSKPPPSIRQLVLLGTVHMHTPTRT
jgi:hypothetical protein